MGCIPGAPELRFLGCGLRRPRDHFRLCRKPPLAGPCEDGAACLCALCEPLRSLRFAFLFPEFPDEPFISWDDLASSDGRGRPPATPLLHWALHPRLP